MALVTAGAPAISSAHGPGPVTSLTFLDRPMALLFFCFFGSEGFLWFCVVVVQIFCGYLSHVHIDYVMRSGKNSYRQRHRRAIADTHLPVIADTIVGSNLMGARVRFAGIQGNIGRELG